MKVPHHALTRCAAACLLATALACSAAVGATDSTRADAQRRYQQDRAVCLGGQSQQDRSTCLREAGAALAEAQRGALTDDTANRARNRQQRCESLPTADRRPCEARMAGQGTTSGSAASGGIYRELVIREPAAPVPGGAASAAR
jgi:hypothetical protein